MSLVAFGVFFWKLQHPESPEESDSLLRQNRFSLALIQRQHWNCSVKGSHTRRQMKNKAFFLLKAYHDSWNMEGWQPQVCNSKLEWGLCGKISDLWQMKHGAFYSKLFNTSVKDILRKRVVCLKDENKTSWLNDTRSRTRFSDPDLVIAPKYLVWGSQTPRTKSKK